MFRKFFSTQAASRRQPARRPLAVEALETRLAPVVGANSWASAVARSGEFDGVVRLTDPNDPAMRPFCTGSLLSTGRHVLTAAHCVDGNGDRIADAPVRVVFDMARGATALDIAFTVPAAHIAVHGSWNGNAGAGNDLAILRLTDQQVNRHLVAPFGATGYDVFSGANEVGQNYTIVGYGETGTGNDGNQRDEVQRVTIGNPVASGTFSLTFNGSTLNGIPHITTAAALAQNLRLLPSFGQGNVAVSTTGLPAGTYDIRFVGARGGQNQPQMTGAITGGAGATLGITTRFDGGGAGVIGVKRSAQNTYDEVRIGGLSLASDFDNGLAANDAVPRTPAHLGLGAAEGFAARGDSGGPGFIRNASGRWEIATVVSYTQPTLSPPDINNYVIHFDGVNYVWRDNSFGEYNVDTRASAHLAGFISPTLAGSYDLVLDMSQQVLGRDGLTENVVITARRNGANLELSVSASAFSGVYYSAPLASINSLTVRGAGDNETLVVDHSNGSPMPVNGLRFEGGAGSDVLLVVGTAGNDAFTVSPTQVSLTGSPAIDYSGTEGLRLSGGDGNDSFTATSFNLTANVIFDGGAGSDTVVLNDTGTTGRSCTFQLGAMVCAGGPIFGLTALEGLTFNAGSGNDSITVQSTPATMPVTLNLGGGNDTVQVTLSVGSSDVVFGNVTVNGQDGTDTLTLSDITSSGLGRTYTLLANSVARTGVGTVTYGTVESMTLTAGRTDDTFLVRGSAAGVAVTLNGGDGNDTFTLGGAGNNLIPIQGPVTVNGGNGTDRLQFNNQSSPTAQVFTLGGSTVRRQIAGPILSTYATVEFVTFNAGSAADTIHVQSTAATTPMTINAGGGLDIINVGSTPVTPVSSRLDTILGALTINGGAGDANLNLRDQGTPTTVARNYTISATGLSLAGVASITWTQARPTLFAGSGNDNISVSNTIAGSPMTINAGAGNDTITVGSSNTLDSIQGPLTVNGGPNTAPGRDLLILEDSASGTGRAYTLTPTTVARQGAALITYGTMEALNLSAGEGDDTLTFQGVAAGQATLFDANLGNDTIIGPDGANTWNLSGSTVAVLNNAIALLNVESLIGGAGADAFIFTSNGQGFLGSLNGMGGVNSLSYAAWFTGVTVNLALGTATGVGGALANIQNATGGRGDDILIGDHQSNVLDGGSGRDILIGGGLNWNTYEYSYAPDTLLGGAGEDILIAGFTNYDLDPASLEAIRTEWSRTDLDYWGRLLNLYYGNETFGGLNEWNVFYNYAAGNVLLGGGDLDWFFGDPNTDSSDLDVNNEWFMLVY